MAQEAVPATSTSIPPISLSATGTGAGPGVGATILTNPHRCSRTQTTRGLHFMSLHQLVIKISSTMWGGRDHSSKFPGHLRAFDRSGKLVDSVDDENVGMGV